MKDLEFSKELIVLLDGRTQKWLADKLEVTTSAISLKLKTGTWTKSEKEFIKSLLKNV